MRKFLPAAYPPWFYASNVPWCIAGVIGIAEQWRWIQLVLLGIMYSSYLICMISFFKRQRKEEEIIQQLLSRTDLDTLEIENGIIGTVKYTKTSTPPSSNHDITKNEQASSTHQLKKQSQKRGINNEN